MKMRKMTALLLAACLAAVIPAAAPAEEEDTIVTIVHTPEQTEAERPPCFPDPTDNYIPLPETENVAEGSAAAVRLNPSAIWEPRTQEITLFASLDGETFTEIAPAAVYTFDAATGNRIRIDFEPVEAAWVRIVITSNSACPAHSGGAQMAEFCVYAAE